MPPISDALSRDVERVWDIEQSRLKSQLFNGRVFSADVISPNLVCGHWTEFRRIVAQMRRPDLHSALGIRPLAVGGVLIGPDGVVFGQRPALSVYQGGEWQLPPAGSVDLTAARRHGRVDYAAMVLAELREEVGLDAHDVQIIGTVGIVEHPGSHVMDLGIAMLTHLSADAIVSRHRSRGNGEYDPLKVVPVAELDSFLKQPNMTLQAPLFLRALRGIYPTHNGILRVTSR